MSTFDFWLYPSSLSLNNGGTYTAPAPGPVSKGDTTDDSTKVAWTPGGTNCDKGKEFTLTALMNGATIPPHDGINTVTVYARMWRSGVGADNWCLWSDTRAQNEDPFVALGVDYSDDGTFQIGEWENYETHNYFGSPKYPSHAGHRMGASNFASHGTTPADSVVEKFAWNVTSRATWTDALLSGLSVRLSNLGTFMGFDVIHKYQGHPRYAPSENTPRWNCSQLAVKVNADDPIIVVPYASGSYFMGE
jgi:hypothetical protein